ncbi:MAG: MMCAP2_0565 family pilin-like conjugal transfer protein [Candidatus Falkowbacteria bacterium]
MLIQSNKEKNKKVAMYYRFLLLVIVAFFVAFISLAPAISFAQVQDEEGGDGFNDLAGLQVVEDTVMLPDTDIRIFIGRLINAVLGLIGIILVGLITYGGWMYMTSAGDATKVEQAKKIMQNAAIGLLIILASFSIVSFILRALGRGGGGGGGERVSRYVDNIGVGALGNGIIQDHYPERNQQDVPINTSIMITFKDAIDPESVCGASSCNDNPLSDDSNIKIYFIASPGISPLSDDTAEEADMLTLGTVLVSSTADNKTFTFTPKRTSNKMLGIQGKEEWYRVKLKNKDDENKGIKKANGEPVTFGLDNFYTWKFQTNGELDVKPPKVTSIFPPADNNKDNRDEEIENAVWVVTLNNQPQAQRNSIQDVDNRTTVTVSVEENNDYQNCIGNGIAAFTVGSGVYNKSVIKDIENSEVKGFNNESEIIQTGNGSFTDIGCGLRLIFNDYEGLGKESESIYLNVALKQNADTLTIGNSTYVFGGNVAVGGDKLGTAGNIEKVINEDDSSLVSAECDGVVCSLIAKVAGDAGNNITIKASREGIISSTLSTVGKRNVDSTTVGAPDVARNAIIQINFDEAINPVTLTKDYIEISTGGSNIAGEFMISNQYKTVEFRTNDLCGQNSCGEDTYCLPEEAKIEALLYAANFVEENGMKISQSDGIEDVAFNSLDGNGDGEMQGPASVFNKNEPDVVVPATNELYGDNYTWSFYTSDQIDLESPIIEYSQQEKESTGYLNLVTNDGQSSGAKITKPLLIGFNKLMMSSSLKPGRDYPNDFYPDTVPAVPKEYAVFVNFSGTPLGYWVSKKDYDTETADISKDGFPDKTEAVISHTRLGESSSYGFVLGSGVKDVYQNCYNPAGDMGADGQSTCNTFGANDSGKSCCKGIKGTNAGDVCYGF